MPLFRRKPTTVEARQFTGQPMSGVDFYDGIPRVTTMQHRKVQISIGEWVVTEPDGDHHYPIADEEFRRIYEEVSR
jgi:hypothetical protein